MRVTSTPYETSAIGHPRRWWILLILCLSLLVLVVDNTVLNLAIPSLMRDLGATPADIQWIIDAYILVFAGLLLTAGSLSDRYGRRRADHRAGVVRRGLAAGDDGGQPVAAHRRPRR